MSRIKSFNILVDDIIAKYSDELNQNYHLEYSSSKIRAMVLNIIRKSIDLNEQDLSEIYQFVKLNYEIKMLANSFIITFYSLNYELLVERLINIKNENKNEYHEYSKFIIMQIIQILNDMIQNNLINNKQVKYVLSNLKIEDMVIQKYFKQNNINYPKILIMSKENQQVKSIKKSEINQNNINYLLINIIVNILIPNKLTQENEEFENLKNILFQVNTNDDRNLIFKILHYSELKINYVFEFVDLIIILKQNKSSITDIMQYWMSKISNETTDINYFISNISSHILKTNPVSLKSTNTQESDQSNLIQSFYLLKYQSEFDYLF